MPCYTFLFYTPTISNPSTTPIVTIVRKIVITLAVLFSAVLSAAATLDKRIIGGEAVKDGEFPFSLQLPMLETAYVEAVY